MRILTSSPPAPPAFLDWTRVACGILRGQHPARPEGMREKLHLWASSTLAGYPPHTPTSPASPPLEHLALVGVGEHQAWIAGHLGGPSLWDIILRPLPPAERALHGLSHVAPPALTLCSFRFSVHTGLGGIKGHQKDWHSSPTFKILPSGIALSLVPKVQPGLLASMSRPGSHPIPSCSQTLWGLGSSIPPCHYPTS